MSYTIKITYKGVEADASSIVAPICRIYHPANSYIDTAVYTQGGPITKNGQPADKIGDVDPNYGKSVYATNVEGFGEIADPDLFATASIPFPIPLAQFKLAMVADAKDGEGHPQVTIETDDYKEAFYYQQVGLALADQGFVVEVKKNEVTVGSK